MLHRAPTQRAHTMYCLLFAQAFLGRAPNHTVYHARLYQNMRRRSSGLIDAEKGIP